MTRTLPLYFWIVGIILSAVYLPRLREILRAYGGFESYLEVGLFLLAGAALVYAVKRNPSRWIGTLARLALLGAAGGLGWTLLANPDARSRFIEAAHLAEYGILGVLAFRAFGTAPSVACAMAVGLFDETVQWALASRTGEIRDVALNGLAGALGTAYSGVVLGFYRQGTRRSLRALLVVAGVLLAGV